MQTKEVIKIIDDINNFLDKVVSPEISFTTMLKVDTFLGKIRQKIKSEDICQQD